MVRKQIGQETAALRNAGFVLLDSLYFERHEPCDPATAWRTGFSLAEVKAGYSLSRECPVMKTDGRPVVAKVVFERLTTGENLVVKGEGGTGKSTVCKQVACRWSADDDRGAVLYRDSETQTLFDESGTLIEAIRAAEDDLLVVVEDAPSEAATAIFEVLSEFEHTGDVAFLLDAREGAWESTTEVADYVSRTRQQLSHIAMPALDERECQRAIEHYQGLTDNEVERTGEQVYEEIRDADIGGALVLVYCLTESAIDPEWPVSTLHVDVQRAYATIKEWDDGANLAQAVAVMVNVLNVASLPVKSAFVHALADDRAEHQQIEHALNGLEGTMLEQSGNDLRPPPQLWSVVYLQHMLDTTGKRIARSYFEQCVNALFRLTDDDARRKQVQGWLRSSSTFVSETPDEAADRFVHRIATIGTTRSTLRALYETDDASTISLPSNCSTTSTIRWVTICGIIYVDRGDFNAARTAFDRLEGLVTSMEADETV